MTALSAAWQHSKKWFDRRRRELRLSVRVALAAFLSFVVARTFDLPQDYWAVFAAVVVTETSVGGSLDAATSWMIGTLGGAIYGAIVAALLPHGDEFTLALELLVGLAPLALLAALYPRFRVAPATTIIVLATVNSSASGPIQSAIDRVVEIGVGSLVGLVVSLFVLPSRAHTIVAETAARLIDQMAQLLEALAAAFGQPEAIPALQARHFEILAKLANLEDLVDDARQERMTRLSNAPDSGPLPRTLHRVRNDLVMMGRAVPEPFPEAVAPMLREAFTRAAQELVAFMRGCAEALRHRRQPPSRDGINAALDHFAETFVQLRQANLIRTQSSEVAGRIFAISFALEQIRSNLKDLSDRVAERVAKR